MRGGWRPYCGKKAWKTTLEGCPSVNIRTLTAISRLSQASLVLNWGNTHQAIGLTHSDCYFGGCRPWFVCPITGRRCAVLYRVHGQWCCRQAFASAYRSQSHQPVERAWTRHRKVTAKLRHNMRRPKGMHTSTHGRLLKQWLTTRMQINNAICAMA